MPMPIPIPIEGDELGVIHLRQILIADLTGPARRPVSLSHQDSCWDSCRRVMMTRAAGSGADSLPGPEALEHGRLFRGGLEGV